MFNTYIHTLTHWKSILLRCEHRHICVTSTLRSNWWTEWLGGGWTEYCEHTSGGARGGAPPPRGVHRGEWRMEMHWRWGQAIWQRHDALMRGSHANGKSNEPTFGHSPLLFPALNASASSLQVMRRRRLVVSRIVVKVGLHKGWSFSCWEWVARIPHDFLGRLFVFRKWVCLSV